MREIKVSSYLFHSKALYQKELEYIFNVFKWENADQVFHIQQN